LGGFLSGLDTVVGIWVNLIYVSPWSRLTEVAGRDEGHER
jgi:hypothetical protein